MLWQPARRGVEREEAREWTEEERELRREEVADDLRRAAAWVR